MKTEPNDPCFNDVISPSTGKIIQPSLTKREHFASLAMQGIFANPKFTEDASSAVREKYPKDDGRMLGKLIAAIALHSADGLIDALNA